MISSIRGRRAAGCHSDGWFPTGRDRGCRYNSGISFSACVDDPHIGISRYPYSDSKSTLRTLLILLCLSLALILRRITSRAVVTVPRPRFS